MRMFLLVLSLSLTAASAQNTNEPSVLADGIFYTQDLSLSPPLAAQGMVYDLRQATPLPAKLAAATKLSETTETLSVVLLNSDAHDDWFNALAARSHQVLLLAPLGTDPLPDISVPVTTDEIAAALSAITDGADLASLASPEIAKRRFDEARLVRHHNGEEEPPVESYETPDEEPAEDNPASLPPDLMLQRAVQILSGLNALGRG